MAAESRRRAELEAKETTRRQGGRSVVESRKVDLQRVIREMEAIVLDLVDKGLFGLEIIDQEEIGLRDTKKTLRLPLWWRRRLGETIEAFETASQKPLSEERATEPAVEEIRGLCDEILKEASLFKSIIA